MNFHQDSLADKLPSGGVATILTDVKNATNTTTEIDEIMVGALRRLEQNPTGDERRNLIALVRAIREWRAESAARKASAEQEIRWILEDLAAAK